MNIDTTGNRQALSDGQTASSLEGGGLPPHSLEAPSATAHESGSKPPPSKGRRLDLWLAAGTGLAALLIYRLTLSCSIAWGDSPELTTAAFLAGIPHPTGYPLYMLLGC